MPKTEKHPEMTGQVVFITGASAGIGEALARVAAERGASVALVARRKSRVEQIAAELSADAIGIEGDVTDDASLQRAVSVVVERFGGIDIVLANAGFGVTGKLRELSIADYQRQFDTNVFGVLRTLYATLPILTKRAGMVGVVGSTNGYVNMPGHSAYCMSKAAIRSLCASVRHELLDHGVSVTHLVPGFVKTDFRKTDNRQVFDGEAPDPIPEWLSVDTLPAAQQMLSAVLSRREEEIITFHSKAAIALERHAHWLVSESMRRSSSLIKRWSKPPAAPNGAE